MTVFPRCRDDPGSALPAEGRVEGLCRRRPHPFPGHVGRRARRSVARRFHAGSGGRADRRSPRRRSARAKSGPRSGEGRRRGRARADRPGRDPPRPDAPALVRERRGSAFARQRDDDAPFVHGRAGDPLAGEAWPRGGSRRSRRSRPRGRDRAPQARGRGRGPASRRPPPRGARGGRADPGTGGELGADRVGRAEPLRGGPRRPAGRPPRAVRADAPPPAASPRRGAARAAEAELRRLLLREPGAPVEVEERSAERGPSRPPRRPSSAGPKPRAPSSTWRGRPPNAKRSRSTSRVATGGPTSLSRPVT